MFKHTINIFSAEILNFYFWICLLSFYFLRQSKRCCIKLLTSKKQKIKVYIKPAYIFACQNFLHLVKQVVW